MRISVIVALFAALLAFVSRPASADLPIHCLNAQVAGDWVFTLDAGGNKPNGHDLRPVSCGFPQPDRNMDHFTRKPTIVPHSKIKVSLQEPNIAVDEKGNKGTWTMIYDEGFEVRVGGQVFFAFHHYTPKKGTPLTSDKVAHYISHCHKTMVGWYRSDDNSNWGCWKGKQVKKLNSWTKKTSSQEDDGKEVVAIVSPTSLVESFNDVTTERSSGKTEVVMDGAAAAGSSSSVFLEQGVNIKSELESYTGISTEFPEIDNNALWEPNYAFIDTVNSDSGSLWKATAHEQFKNKPVSEMMRMLGMKRFHKNAGGSTSLPQPITRDANKSDKEKYGDLPSNWDWTNINGVNYDTEIRNQGSCGSCYAMASISALESRFRVASRLQFRPLLSPQEALSCSFYNQGCEGGYPFLIGKHGAEFGFADAMCQGYNARNEQCPNKCNIERYRVTNYSYVGGYYGGCSEVAMMREIYERGPVMVAFQAPPDLFYYTSGIYTGPSPKSEPQGVANVNVWQQTNHAVVAVGWGVDKATGTKYWKLKNTWGLKWGEDGYFRIRRGTNECGVESMATKADVILPSSVKIPDSAPNPYKAASKTATFIQMDNRRRRMTKTSNWLRTTVEEDQE